MKKWLVSIRHRGSNYKFERPLEFTIYANTKADAIWEVISRYGDIYVAKAKELKD